MSEKLKYLSTEISTWKLNYFINHIVYIKYLFLSIYKMVIWTIILNFAQSKLHRDEVFKKYKPNFHYDWKLEQNLLNR